VHSLLVSIPAQAERWSVLLTSVSPCVQALALAQMLQDTEEWEIEFADVLRRFEERFERKLLYTFVFF
jgi:hypothetical protein